MNFKAFKTCPCVESLMPTIISAGRKKISHTEITCLDCCNDNLYVGTDDGFIHHYYSSAGDGFNKIRHAPVSTKKLVTQLKVLSAINRLIVLSDSCIFLYFLDSLKPTSISRIKGVSSFTLNEKTEYDNPFGVEISVCMKRRAVQLYHVTENKISTAREVISQEPPLKFILVGQYFCACLSSLYKIGNIDATDVISRDLFPYGDDLTPVICHLQANEFLVNAPGHLGMFADDTGSSNRPPLQWSSRCLDFVFTHPYAVVLHDHSVSIHNISDQVEKQQIPIDGGKAIYLSDGKVFVVTSTSIIMLHQFPIENQIEDLLTNGNLDEALCLAKNARNTLLSKDQLYALIHDIQLKFAFVNFSKMNFQKAQSLFNEVFLDIRELLCLYDHLSPLSLADFTSNLEASRDFMSVSQLIQGSATAEKDVEAYDNFLCERLLCISNSTEYKIEVHSTLLHLYARRNSSALVDFIRDPGHQIEASSSLDVLSRHGRLMALGCLQLRQGDHKAALTTWESLYDDKETFDCSFPGLSIIVSTLISPAAEDALVAQHLAWLCERDADKTHKVFLQRFDRLQHVEDFDMYICEIKNAKSLIFLYEYLVNHRKLQVKKYHEKLAILYLDQILSDSNTNRKNFQEFLKDSDLYDAKSLLQQISSSELYEEQATLYGKLGDDEKAIDILVVKKQEMRLAELYCLRCHDNDKRKQLFLYLLRATLKRNTEKSKLIELLKRNYSHYDLEQVLSMLPSDWTVHEFSPFLMLSMRYTLSDLRTNAVRHGLVKGALATVARQKLSLATQSITLTDDSICDICGREFEDSNFTMVNCRQIVHKECLQDA